MRILVVQTAFLGDLILCFPMIKRLSELYPKATITIVVRAGLAEFLKDLDIADEILEVKKGSHSDYAAVYQKLSSHTWDLIFCPHGSLRSALFIRRLVAKEKIGFKRPWNFLFFSKRVKKDMDLPEALRQMQLLTPFSSSLSEKISQFKTSYDVLSSGQLDEPGVATPKTEIPDWARADFREVLKDHEGAWRGLVSRHGLEVFVSSPYVILVPGSVWETKKWTEKGYRELAGKFVSLGYKVIILGNTQEKQLGDRIANDQHTSILNLSGKTTLLESLLLMQRSQLVVSNDSGSQHLASLVETPLVSIFGPTVLSQGFGPWQNKAVVAQATGLTCRPCGRHGHDKCPIGTHVCMTSLTPDSVYQASLKVSKSPKTL